MIYHLKVGKRDEKAKAKMKVYADTKVTAIPSGIAAGMQEIRINFLHHLIPECIV